MAQKVIIALPVLALAILIYILNRPVRFNSNDVPGFSPIKNDELARKFSPLLIPKNEYGLPKALYYRASKDDSDNIHLTYHFVWDNEENTGSGLKPFLSRWIYTGGLSIQKIMYGKKDLEIVAFTLNPNEEIIKVVYETAENYNDGDFSVKHKTIVLEGKFEPRLVFEVISWNHLFNKIDKSENELDGQVMLLNPEYFSEELWKEYEIVKEEETILKKNRAHQIYEREYVK